MKICELCESPARVYCDSDQTILCWDCDSMVHEANFLVARHSRSLLCKVCQSPTPWSATGSTLGPTVSVCSRCVRDGGTEIRSADAASGESDGRNEVEIDGEYELGYNEYEDEDDEDDGLSNSGEDEDGDDQVVPSSSPPPATSSSREEYTNRTLLVAGGNSPFPFSLKRPRGSSSSIGFQEDLVSRNSQIEPAADPATRHTTFDRRMSGEQSRIPNGRFDSGPDQSRNQLRDFNRRLLMVQTHLRR